MGLMTYKMKHFMAAISNIATLSYFHPSLIFVYNASACCAKCYETFYARNLLVFVIS
jgi:hypothetical protein